MLLRRVISHFRKQEWTAIALDFLIVVIGVFVATQVANWNSARIERLQERDYLVRLHEDFVESVNGQARDLRFLDQQLADQSVILKSLDACAVAPDDDMAFQRGINTLGFINSPRLYRRTIDEMAGSGRSDILRSQALKRKLDQIVAVFEWRENGFESVNRMTEHYRYILEEKTRYDLSRTYPDEFLGNFTGVDYDIAALCKDPAIASAVSAISYTTRERRNAYTPGLASYEAFLPMLQTELTSRWGEGALPETVP